MGLHNCASTQIDEQVEQVIEDEKVSSEEEPPEPKRARKDRKKKVILNSADLSSNL